MQTAGGGWTLIAYAADNSAGFPRMDIDVWSGSWDPVTRSGKASRDAVRLTRGATEMALVYHSATGSRGYISDSQDAVSFVIPARQDSAEVFS